MAALGGDRALCPLAGEPFRARTEEDGEDRNRQDDEGRSDHPQSLAGPDDQRRRADRERHPGASTEREVERGEQNDEADRRADPHRRPRLEDEAEREQDPEDAEDPEPVPVSDRAGQAIDRDGVVAAEPVGEEPRRQRVERFEGDRGGDRACERGHGVPATEEEERRDAGDVDERTLDLEQRLRGVGRPGDRERDPEEERRERPQQHDVEAPQLVPSPDHGPEPDHPAERQRSPAPGGREVPALGAGHEQEQERRPGDRARHGRRVAAARPIGDAWTCPRRGISRVTVVPGLPA